MIRLALGRGHPVVPRAVLERRARRRDGAVDVLGIPLGDPGERLPGRRVRRFERLARRSVRPLPVDEQLPWGSDELFDVPVQGDCHARSSPLVARWAAKDCGQPAPLMYVYIVDLRRKCTAEPEGCQVGGPAFPGRQPRRSAVRRRFPSGCRLGQGEEAVLTCHVIPGDPGRLATLGDTFADVARNLRPGRRQALRELERDLPQPPLHHPRRGK